MHQGWSSIKKLWRCLRRVSKKSQGCSDDLHFSESLWFLMFQSQTCRYAQYQCIDLLLVFLPWFCESITHPAGPSLKFSGGHYFLWGLATKIWLHGLRKPEISEISISRSQQLGRHAILGTYGNHGLYDWHGLTDDIWWCWAKVVVQATPRFVVRGRATLAGLLCVPRVPLIVFRWPFRSIWFCDWF